MKSKLLFLHYLRGISALSVLLYHFCDRIPILKEIYFLKYIRLYGHKGVDIFFFISGFVIFKTLENKNSNFWLGRFKRLFPVYWFSLVFVFLLQFYGYSSRLYDINRNLIWDQLNAFFVNFTMFQSFFNIDDLDGAAWTLGVELNFYIIIYFLVITFKKKWTFLILNALLLLQFCYRIDSLGLPGEYFFNKYLLGKYLSLFISGIFCYEIFKNDNESRKIFDFNTILRFLLLLFSLSIQSFQYYKNNDYGGFFVIIILIIVGVWLRTVERLIRFNFLFNYLGNISYPLYLLHSSIGWFLIATIENLYCCIFLIFTIPFLISWLVHKYIEIPFINVKF